MPQSLKRKAKTQDASTQVANREGRKQDETERPHPLLELQRIAGNQAVSCLINGGGLQAKLRTVPQDGMHGREAYPLASPVAGSASGLTVQRKCAACSTGAPCSECANEEQLPLQRKSRSESLSPTGLSIQRAPAEHSSAATTTTTPDAAAPPAAIQTRSLIVEDEGTDLQSGQMRKSDFLSQLRSAVCSTADEALAKAGRNTEGCPYIERWFSHYADKNAEYVERSLRKYAPEAGEATSARDYIPIICNRVRHGVEVWAKTGEITGVPDELAGALSGGITGALSAVGSMIGSAVSGIVSGVGSALSSIGRIFKKKREGREKSNDPAEVQSQLNEGRTLDSHVQARMGAAFGRDFSQVRIHTDSGAAGLSDRLNARAFTVGSDIAFAAGEYQPGTMIGEALIAHELAHVVQQQGGGGSSAPQSKGYDDHQSLEDEADVSAVGAVMSAWGGVKGALSDIGRNAMPRLKSGLRLQRCSKSKYVTNVGESVETPGSCRPNQPDVTPAEADAQLNALGLLSKVTKLAPPTNRYDCHGYTFLNGAACIDDSEVDAILHDNGYLVTTAPKVGDILIYRKNGEVKHSGIITAVTGGTVTRINSKWGILGLYSHAPKDVPSSYGTFTPWHTTRAGGHKLHERSTK